jgi:hypothetical protein
MITILTKQLLEYLSLLPQCSQEFLNTYIFQSWNFFFELVLLCPDKLVRSCVIQVLNHLVNLSIDFNRMDLSPEKLEYVRSENLSEALMFEINIINFLMIFQDKLHNEVAKNWMKFGQYFEVPFSL